MNSPRWRPAIWPDYRVSRRSAKALFGSMTWLNRLVFALLAVLVGGMLLRGGQGYANSAVLTFVMLALVLDVVSIVVLVIVFESRKRRELRMGYTTVTNQYPQVDQIDPKSGQVVRLAGEDILTREEYLERIRLIREFATGAASD